MLLDEDEKCKMSATQIPTFEEMMLLFRETREQFHETREQFAEIAAAQKQTSKHIEELRLTQKDCNQQIAKLGDRMGDLIQSMVEGGVLRLFQDLGYTFTRFGPRVRFKREELNVSGEIDLFLENGDIACLVEVKTNLSTDDVRAHVEKLRNFRIYADAGNDPRKFIAAVGGGVVLDNVRIFAQRQGMYVIQQSGDNVEVIAPEGKPKVW
jgi:Holliday junction resolvase-like predicted endonuclease/DNA-binding XRE family transcriptional regulator